VNLRRIRGFLDLKQREVENATGVPAYRLSQAELGRIRLNETEWRALKSFYKARWEMAVGEQQEFTLNS
jgi:hypothetical protein